MPRFIKKLQVFRDWDLFELRELVNNFYERHSNCTTQYIVLECKEDFLHYAFIEYSEEADPK